MHYVRLGSTGLEVSRICLGCMSFGDRPPAPMRGRSTRRASRPFIQRALEAGINFFDTANVYSLGIE